MHDSIATIASTAYLTVKELPTSLAGPSSYSFVDALSDAGVYIPKDHNPQAVERPAHEHNTLYLWESGCRTNDGWDCRASCMDTSTRPRMVWNSTNSIFTLQNCLVYPILGYSAARGWLNESSPGLLEKYGIPLNDSVSFEDSREHNKFWPAIRDCRGAMCSDVLFPDINRCPADAHTPYNATQLVHSVGSWRPHLVCWTVWTISVGET